MKKILFSFLIASSCLPSSTQAISENFISCCTDNIDIQKTINKLNDLKTKIDNYGVANIIMHFNDTEREIKKLLKISLSKNQNAHITMFSAININMAMLACLDTIEYGLDKIITSNYNLNILLNYYETFTNNFYEKIFNICLKLFINVNNGENDFRNVQSVESLIQKVLNEENSPFFDIIINTKTKAYNRIADAIVRRNNLIAEQRKENIEKKEATEEDYSEEVLTDRPIKNLLGKTVDAAVKSGKWTFDAIKDVTLKSGIWTARTYVSCAEWLKGAIGKSKRLKLD